MEKTVPHRLPPIDMAATGRRIERLRTAAGITVRQLQAVFGFNTPQAIYKWQRGQALPSLDNLITLSAVFHVPMEQIIICK